MDTFGLKRGGTHPGCCAHDVGSLETPDCWLGKSGTKFYSNSQFPQIPNIYSDIQMMQHSGKSVLCKFYQYMGLTMKGTYLLDCVYTGHPVHHQLQNISTCLCWWGLPSRCAERLLCMVWGTEWHPDNQVLCLSMADVRKTLLRVSPQKAVRSDNIPAHMHRGCTDHVACSYRHLQYLTEHQSHHHQPCTKDVILDPGLPD